MKIKHLILATTMVLAAATNAFGQIQQGDKNIGLTVLFSSQTQEVFVNDNPSSQPPASMQMGIGATYNYFVSNRFSIGASLSGTYTSTPIGKKANGTYLYTTTYGFLVAPEVRYYLPITDQLYWVISASLGFNYGKYKKDQNPGDPIETSYKALAVSVAPIGLEFRVSDKISVGMSVGGFARTSTYMTAEGVDVRTNQTLWQINRADLSLNIWL
jgi:hypothetical protein